MLRPSPMPQRAISRRCRPRQLEHGRSIPQFSTLALLNADDGDHGPLHVVAAAGQADRLIALEVRQHRRGYRRGNVELAIQFDLAGWDRDLREVFEGSRNGRARHDEPNLRVVARRDCARAEDVLRGHQLLQIARPGSACERQAVSTAARRVGADFRERHQQCFDVAVWPSVIITFRTEPDDGLVDDPLQAIEMTAQLGQEPPGTNAAHAHIPS
jgi:hypothetical protein